jgi:hypothetical protein
MAGKQDSGDEPVPVALTLQQKRQQLKAGLKAGSEDSGDAPVPALTLQQKRQQLKAGLKTGSQDSGDEAVPAALTLQQKRQQLKAGLKTGSDDSGDEPVVPALSLQQKRQQLKAGYASKESKDNSSSMEADAAVPPAFLKDDISMTEISDNIPVPKSRPLGRRVSTRRSMMQSQASAGNGMFASSRGNMSRTSSGESSSGATPGTGRRGSVILAQLRASASQEAASFQDDDVESGDEEDDRLIALAIGGAMAGEKEEAPGSDGARPRLGGRDPPGSNFKASVSSRRASTAPPRKEPGQLESRFAGMSFKMPPTTSILTHNQGPGSVGKLGDSISSFDRKEAPSSLSSPKKSPVSSPKKSPVPPPKEETPGMLEESPGGPAAAAGGGEASGRPSLGERQPSWMRDAMEQMSAVDLEAFLKDDSHGGGGGNDSAAAGNDTSGGFSAGASAASLSFLDGFENNEVLEQYRIIAHHEAHQRVKENLGYDPVERMEEEQLNVKEGSSSGGAGGKKANLSKEITLPPMCPPTVVPVTKTGICLPKQALPECRLLAPTATPRQEELCEGEDVPAGNSRVDNETIVVVRCLGCRIHLQVPVHATLVHCPKCSTISPATSTR